MLPVARKDAKMVLDEDVDLVYRGAEEDGHRERATDPLHARMGRLELRPQHHPLLFEPGHLDQELEQASQDHADGDAQDRARTGTEG